MSQALRDLLAAALQLPAQNRAALVEQLLNSLPDDFASGYERAFAEELELRLADYQRNPESGDSWDALKKASE